MRWCDLDAAQARIHIQRAIIWRKADDPRGRWYLSDPKTESSSRMLRLDAGMLDQLSAHRKSQLEERMRAGKAWRDQDFIFCNEIGEPYSQANLRNKCKNILRAAKLPEIFNPYSARHSSATWMIEHGVSAKTAAGRLGHGDVATTMRYYVHSTEGMDEQAVETLTQVLKGKK